MSKNVFEQATSEWMTVAQQFFNAFQSGATQSGNWAGGMPSWNAFSSNDWMKPLSSMASAIPGTPGEVAEKATASMRHFFQMMQSLLPGGLDTLLQSDPSKAFSEAISRAFKEWTPQHNPAMEALQSALATGSKSLQDGMPDLSAFTAPFKSEAAQMLGIPAFGMMRQKQERMQQLFAGLMNYQDTNQAYNALMLKASYRGLEKMEGKLAERSEPGRQIDSMRALYDLWVDAAEEGFAEVALSDEFRKAYGELVDSQMRVRALVQKEVEESCAQFSIPTRTELNSVHRKLAEMARRIRELEDRLEFTREPAPTRTSETARASVPARAREATSNKPSVKKSTAAKKSTTKNALPSKQTQNKTAASESKPSSFASALAEKRKGKSPAKSTAAKKQGR